MFAYGIMLYRIEGHISYIYTVSIEVKMESYDGAEVYELVGLYVLEKLSEKWRLLKSDTAIQRYRNRNLEPEPRIIYANYLTSSLLET